MKKYLLKIVFCIIILLFVIIIMIPKTDYFFLNNPNIPYDVKVIRTAESKIEDLGYNIVRFEAIISKNNGKLLIYFIPKRIKKDDVIIRVQLDEDFKIISCEEWIFNCLPPNPVSGITERKSG